MKRAYVDASVLVGLHFHERAAAGLWKRLRGFEQLISSAIVTAELLSSLSREGRPLKEADAILARFATFAPDVSLREECEEALAHGKLRGADLWHVACALAIAGRRLRKALTFFTLDASQAAVAAALGFEVLPAPAPKVRR